MQTLRRLAALSAVLAALTLAPRADAASSTCVMAIPHTSCTTGAVRANTTNHFIFFWVSGGYVNFRLYDTANGVTVYSGNSGFDGYDRTVNGLYSTYRLKISGGYDIGSIGSISNT